MKKSCLIFILFFISISFLHSDFIIPYDDPVYSFLESMNNSGYTEKTFFIYPQYYNEIVDILQHLRTQDLPKQYQKLTEYHYERLSMKFPEGLNSDVFPLRKIPKAVIGTFKPHSDKKRLATYNKNEFSLFLSGMMGVNFDIKSNDETYNRRYEYYGLEFGGNIKENFGFYSQYRKGHYNGNEEFIKENPQVTLSGEEGKLYLVTSQSELDFKNKYLNLSSGFGTFQIGKTISSSIILNSYVSPMGYFKYYQNFGKVNYLSINAQLIPDSLNELSTYKTKSFSIQTIYLDNNHFSFGIGEGVIYGDKSIDLANISPLVFFKLVDIKYHERDNIVVFAYGTIRPIKNILLFSNFLIDDFKKKRLFTKEFFSGFAIQSGCTYDLSTLPLQFAFEITAIGSRTYCHKTGYLSYTHDNQILGYPNGSNQLNIAAQIQYLHPQIIATLYYDNMQQGSISNNPFVPQPNTEFLAGKISRAERVITELEFYFFPEVTIHLKYEFQKKEEINTNYLYSGLEVRY